jgi:hypothetical protein
MQVKIDTAAVDTVIIPAGTPGERIIITGGFLLCDIDGTVRFESNVAGGTDLSGLLPLRSGFVWEMKESSCGWILPTSPGHALNMELGAGMRIAGVLSYEYVSRT